jgi:hypothetical protein
MVTALFFSLKSKITMQGAAQGSKEWLREKLGVFSGSKMSDLVPYRTDKKADGSRKQDYEDFINRKNPELLKNLIAGILEKENKAIAAEEAEKDKIEKEAEEAGKKPPKRKPQREPKINYTVNDLLALVEQIPPDRVRPDDLSTGALSYIYIKAAELVIPEFEPEIRSDAIDWGNYYEDEMFEKVQELIGIELETPPFMMSTCENFGTSPDRINEKHGLVFEGKCPFYPYKFLRQSAYSAEDLKNENRNYYIQCQTHIAVTGAECFWVNYDPRVANKNKQLSIIHVPRDEEVIEDILYWTEKGEAKKQEFVQDFLRKREEGLNKLRQIIDLP